MYVCMRVGFGDRVGLGWVFLFVCVQSYLLARAPLLDHPQSGAHPALKGALHRCLDATAGSGGRHNYFSKDALDPASASWQRRCGQRLRHNPTGPIVCIRFAIEEYYLVRILPAYVDVSLLGGLAAGAAGCSPSISSAAFKKAIGIFDTKSGTRSHAASFGSSRKALKRADRYALDRRLLYEFNCCIYF